jgi:aspartate/glutamate racemase
MDYELKAAKSLLKKDSNEILPQNVEKIIEFCVNRSVGFILSRNIKSYSCRDARSNRVRLGHAGIPLYDEFKSIVFEGIDRNRKKVIIAAHCRGHMSINLQIIKELCDLLEIPTVLPQEILEMKYGMVLGTVNPILIELNSNNRIINVFDNGLQKSMTVCPGTMMTNAGELTWGIEFDPEKLIKAISNKKVASIAFPDKELKPYEIPSCINPKSIGIITGNGAESGITLWRRINKYFVENLGEHFLGDISLPKVIVVSLPAMGLSMELDKRTNATWETISEAVNRLIDQDVDILTLACNTTDFFSHQIRSLFEKNGKQYISISEVTIDYLKENHINDVAILGIDYVASLGRYSAYTSMLNLKVEKVPESTMQKFHELGYGIKKMNNKHRSFQQFVNLMQKEISAKNVVIALTELSILCEELRKKHCNGKVIIDTLDIYAEIIANRSLGLIIEEGLK